MAQRSFVTILSAFIAYRGLLTLEFLFGEPRLRSGTALMPVIIDGRRAGRAWAGQAVAAATVLTSAIFAIIAIVLPRRTSGQAAAKIAVFYLGPLTEIFAMWIQFLRGTLGPVSSGELTERYSAFTLIILCVSAATCD